MVNPSTIFAGRSKSRIVKTKTKDSNNVEIELEWKVKPLAPRLMVKYYNYFAALEKLNQDGKELTEEQQIETLEKLSPLIEVVLPFCCLEPKIVFEGETNTQEVNIDDIDIETLMGLFTAIFESSGMNKKSEDERKNSEKSPSQKALPPSA